MTLRLVRIGAGAVAALALLSGHAFAVNPNVISIEGN